MEPHIKNIVEELIKIDPRLKGGRMELEKVVQKLLESKPNAKIDPHFVTTLQNELSSEITLMTREDELETPGFMERLRRLFYPLAGGVFAVLLLTIIVVNDESKDLALSSEVEVMDVDLARDWGAQELAQIQLAAIKEGTFELDDPRFDSGADYAFVTEYKTTDDLIVGSTSLPVQPETESLLSTTVSFTGDDETSLVNESTAEGVRTSDEGDQVGTVTSAVETLVEHEYVYVGEPLELDDMIEVYKADVPTDFVAVLVRWLGHFDLKTADLESLNIKHLKQVTLSQAGDFAYDFKVDLESGDIGLAYAPDTWPPDDQNVESLFSVDDSKEVALAFFEDNEVALSPYASSPEYDPVWLDEYGHLLESSDPPDSLPDEIDLIFPLMLDGHFLVNEAGVMDGIEVTVSSAFGRVTHVDKMRLRTLQQTSHLGADWDAVMKALNSGQFYYAELFENGSQVALNTPKKVLIQVKNDHQDTFLVPALSFDVLTDDLEVSSRDTIIVPLLEDLLDLE